VGLVGAEPQEELSDSNLPAPIIGRFSFLASRFVNVTEESKGGNTSPYWLMVSHSNFQVIDQELKSSRAPDLNTKYMALLTARYTRSDGSPVMNEALLMQHAGRKVGRVHGYGQCQALAIAAVGLAIS
jgi:hypothetical protein